MRPKTHVKLCECGHGKSIHAGIFQVHRTGPAKCNYPGCRCRDYAPVAATAQKSSGALPGDSDSKTKA